MRPLPDPQPRPRALVGVISHLFLFVDKAAGLRVMRDVPAEVNLDISQLAVPRGDEFRVAEGASIFHRDFVSDEGALVVLRQQPLDIDRRDGITARPATREEGLTVESIVERLVKWKS
jgi:hypothetical protein